MKNIFLKKLQLSNAAEFTRLANNKNIWLYMQDTFPYLYRKKDAVSFINFSLKSKTSHIFGIFYQNKFAGAIGLHQMQDLNRFCYELGYWIAQPFWNKGIVTKAVTKIITYGFENLNTNRIFASTLETNLASKKVLEKNNFIFEGVSRISAFKNNQFLDEHRFGLLKDGK